MCAQITTVVKNREDLQRLVGQCMARFAENNICRSIESGAFTLNNYSNVLRMLFHQVYNSSNSFALAAAGLPPARNLARDYLIKHAEEEKLHWKWIVEDLQGITGKPEGIFGEFAPTPCQAYISFNFYIASRAPIARLGIAAMLESLGATFSKSYAERICKDLKLKATQCSFFFGHGDTDVKHTQEILDVLQQSNLSLVEWSLIANVAKTAFELYGNMLDESLKL